MSFQNYMNFFNATQKENFWRILWPVKENWGFKLQNNTHKTSSIGERGNSDWLFSLVNESMHENNSKTASKEVKMVQIEGCSYGAGLVCSRLNRLSIFTCCASTLPQHLTFSKVYLYCICEPCPVDLVEYTLPGYSRMTMSRIIRLKL